MTDLQGQGVISGVKKWTCHQGQGTAELHLFHSPTFRTHFSKMVRASISAFSLPGTSNLLVSVRDTSVLARASLFGSFKLPALSPKVLGG